MTSAYLRKPVAINAETLLITKGLKTQHFLFLGIKHSKLQK